MMRLRELLFLGNEFIDEQISCGTWGQRMVQYEPFKLEPLGSNPWMTVEHLETKVKSKLDYRFVSSRWLFSSTCFGAG